MPTPHGPPPPTIAARLTLAREARERSMNNLTVAAGLSGAAVHFIENHPESDVRTSTILALSFVLDIHPAWLAFGTGEMEGFPEDISPPNMRRPK